MRMRMRMRMRTGALCRLVSRSGAGAGGHVCSPYTHLRGCGLHACPAGIRTEGAAGSTYRPGRRSQHRKPSAPSAGPSRRRKQWALQTTGNRYLPTVSRIVRTSRRSRLLVVTTMRLRRPRACPFQEKCRESGPPGRVPHSGVRRVADSRDNGRAHRRLVVTTIRTGLRILADDAC